uniref:tRNA pseudouridine synthase 1 n=1 Tax=Anthurium amnicola TaxID=1678845 RepID=A0A1D1YUF1_9ARAE
MASPPPPSSSPPPPNKKLKMSPTTASDDDDEDEPHNEAVEAPPPPLSSSTGEPKRRFKRRKVAIYLGYCGAGYQGMQKNPGARTIEGDLEEALFLSDAVPEPDRGRPRRYDWARAARTDKGVSAAFQVVSGRFYVDPPGLVGRLHTSLPPQIRVFGYTRVTASFNAKRFCDRRRYVYLLPVFALDPNAHPDRESVMASLGSENELAKCLECSERGRKVASLMGRQEEGKTHLGAGEEGAEVRKRDVEADNAVAPACSESESVAMSEDSALGGEKDTGNAGSEVPVSVEEEGAKCKLPSGESKNGDEPNTETGIPKAEEMPEAPQISCGNGAEQTDARTGEFRYGEKERERFNAVLGRYVGSHNFHNFTTRTKAEDPSARRYILSFDASSVAAIDGIEFVRCEVVGQSFMLHQIRKMIGLAVAVMRNCTPESMMETALRKDVNINVPTAPEVGLYLDECIFASYNQKWKDSHEPVAMGAYADQVEEFKTKYILSHIAAMELKEGAVALWLHSLNHRNYPDFRFTEAGAGCSSVEEGARAGSIVEQDMS